MTEPSGKPDPSAPPPAEPDEGTSFAGDMGRLFVIPAVIVGLSLVVFLLFGWIASDGKSAGDYLQEVRQGGSGRKWQAAFELSRILVRDEDARKDPRLGGEVAGLLGDPEMEDPLVRRYLLLALEEIGDPAHAGAVSAALVDPDPGVRLYAARAMSVLGRSPADPALVEMVSDDDPALRKMALYALGRIGDAAAVPAIRPRLDDPVEDVRWNAALALAVLGDASGIGVIRQMLDSRYLDGVEGITESQKVEARLNAVQAAYLLGAPELKTIVEEIGRHDSSLKVRDAALRAVAEWR